MSVNSSALLFFGSLLFFLFIGTPLTFTLGGIWVIFLYFTMGPVGFYIVASKFWDSMMSFTLIAIPMYVYMAMLLEKSGVANDLYRMMHVWFGGFRGGLAIGTVAICAIFAAMSGISGAAVVTMGTIALPRMLERGYDKRLAVGAINCGGGWGILIPPSILMVLYALLTEVSVGRLFASGIGPGMLLFVLVSDLYRRAGLAAAFACACVAGRGARRLETEDAIAEGGVPAAVHRVPGARRHLRRFRDADRSRSTRRVRRAGRLGGSSQAVNGGADRRRGPDPAADRADHVDPVRRACVLDRVYDTGRQRTDRKSRRDRRSFPAANGVRSPSCCSCC